MIAKFLEALIKRGKMQEDLTYSHFAIASASSLVLIMIGTFIFHEMMRHAWRRLRQIEHRPLLTIHLGMLTMFLCHTIVVWLFGISYWLMIERWHFGSLSGDYRPGHLLTYIYFSATTYSSLGFGDIYPKGPMRLMTGVEAIYGLILIGWSIAYSFVAAERYLGHERKNKD
jgi:hypothetical protein